jgi:hypothetical protein
MHVHLTVASDMKDLRDFKQLVAFEAQRKRPKTWPMNGGIQLLITFSLERPKSLPKKVVDPLKRPAIDKLLNAVISSLTGILITDGSQVLDVMMIKEYGRRRSSSAKIVVDTIPARKIIKKSKASSRKRRKPLDRKGEGD